MPALCPSRRRKSLDEEPRTSFFLSPSLVFLHATGISVALVRCRTTRIPYQTPDTSTAVSRERFQLAGNGNVRLANPGTLVNYPGTWQQTGLCTAISRSGQQLVRRSGSKKFVVVRSTTKMRRQGFVWCRQCCAVLCCVVREYVVSRLQVLCVSWNALLILLSHNDICSRRLDGWQKRQLH